MVGVSPGCVVPGYSKDGDMQHTLHCQSEERYLQPRFGREGTFSALAGSKAENATCYDRFDQRQYMSTQELKHMASGSPTDLATAWSMITLLMDRLVAVESTVNLALSTAVQARNAVEDLTSFAVDEDHGDFEDSVLERGFTQPLGRASTGWTESGLSEADSELLALKARLLEIRQSLTQPSSESPLPSSGRLLEIRQSLTTEPTAESPLPSSRGRPTTRSTDRPTKLLDFGQRSDMAAGIRQDRRGPLVLPRALAPAEDSLGPPTFRRVHDEQAHHWAGRPQRAAGDMDSFDPCDDKDIAEEVTPTTPCHMERFRTAQSCASTVSTEHSRPGSDDSGITWHP